MPKLTITLSDGSESSRILEEPIITVGRSPDNSIQIDHPSVSGHHAQLSLEGGDYHLKDMNSTNGTRVNGVNIFDQQLQGGDHIRFGKIDAIYASEVSRGGGGTLPLPVQNTTQAAPANSSTLPPSFANASPFAKAKRSRKDPAGQAIMVLGLLALLAFGAVVAYTLSLTPPA